MIENQGTVAPRGDLVLKVIRGNRLAQQNTPSPYVHRGYRPGNLKAATLNEIIRMALRDGLPSMEQSKELRAWKVRNMPNLWRGFRRVGIAWQFGIATMVGDLRLVKIFGDLGPTPGLRLDYGLASLRVVTDAGVAFMVDAFQNLVELELMNFHGIGTGTTAEAAADTALVTELTTEYNPNSTRATGTQSEPSANIYRTTGTNTLDSGSPVLREHGVFSANAAGTLLDRSVFAAITLTGANGDGLQSQYSLTLTSGG